MAVSSRGDAVVAWIQVIANEHRALFRIRSMRRAAGGAFRPAATHATITPLSFPTVVRAGIAATGETIVAWIRPPASAWGPPATVEVTIIPPGADVGHTQTVGPIGVGDTPGLAVAPDGRAVLSLRSGGALRVAERPPGGVFGAPVRVAGVTEPFGVQSTAVIRPDGAALVGWYGLSEGGVGVVSRAGVGPFGAPVTVQRPRPDRSIDPVTRAVLRGWLGGFGYVPDLTSGNDVHGGDLRALPTVDGRALLTWAGARPGDGIGTWPAPRAASVPLGGGSVDVTVLGSPLRDAGAIVPVALADGRPAVAWIDDRPDNNGHDRLQLALAGGAGVADPTPPRVTIGRPIHTRISVDGALELPVRCSAACEVRAGVDGRASDGGLTLARAGRGILRITPRHAAPPLAPLQRGRVRVRVLYGVPGARHPVERVVPVTLVRPRPAPVPRVIDVRARRVGSSIVVR